jgi:hypothetical protein
LDDADPPGYALAALIAIECGVLVVGTAIAAISIVLDAPRGRSR